MLKLAEVPVQGTPNAALSPGEQRWAREGALMSIRDGDDITRWLSDETDRALVAKAIAELKAEGVSPQQAANLLTRLRGGNGLRVISGGGERPETATRPVLRLVTSGGAS